MKYRLNPSLFVLLTALFIGLGFPPFEARAQEITPNGSLARIDVQGPLQDLHLPVYAHLVDQSGSEYALVITPVEQLYISGLVYQTIDFYADPGSYLLALERRKGAREEAARQFEVLFDDGRYILVKNSSEISDALAEMGFDLLVLPDTPMSLREAPIPTSLAITYDARVAAMIDQVIQSTVYDQNGNLSGENQVLIGGSPYTITTRNTDSGTPVAMATQYAYERMEAFGLAVSYHDWTACGRTNRNVVGAKTGALRPDEIVLITAHLDSMPSSGSAPGADDNASGSAGLLVASSILGQNNFERTVRFVFFTGEEQGLCGSSVYANLVASAGDNIVAVYNMDMIAWDAIDGPTLRLHTRPINNPGYPADAAIASLFTEVVDTYGLSSALTPIIDADGESASDHYYFWQHGFAGILAIEDDRDDFNSYYHTANDKRQYLNMNYFTSFVKASVGTVAHLAYPFTDSDNPILYVTLSGDGRGAVTSAPQGIDCGIDCSEMYQSGMVVTLTATADPGFVFAGWSSSGCSGTGACAITLYGDITVTATFDISPQLSISEGTIGTKLTIQAGTSGFGNKKGKVLIGNTNLKILEWSNDRIDGIVTRVSLPASINNVFIKVQPYKTAPPIIFANAFTVMKPVIDSLSADFGSPEVEITVRGWFFGTKKSKVYLEDPVHKVKKACKVTHWSMAPSTGDSEIRFVVPKVSNSFAPGTYQLRASNKVGSVLTNFTVTP